MAELIDRWNSQYFDGKLSPKVLEQLSEIPNQSEEVILFVERCFRFMKISGYRAVDFSPMLAWAYSFLPQRILPGSWGGAIPPITVGGRHIKIDEYMERNPWTSFGPGSTLLDVGCGFPPLTTIETAERFPEWKIVGADPSFGKYLLYDPEGDYACLNDDGTLRYFQPGAVDLIRYNRLYADPKATRKRFQELFAQFSAKMPPAESTAYVELQFEGARLLCNPVQQHERSNLTFHQGGLGTIAFRGIDALRSMNVLLYYDSAFRNRVLDWAAETLRPGGIFICGTNWFQSTNSRYTVYIQEADRMVPKEFAFSMDNFRSQSIISWFALHDDEYETQVLASLLAILRADSSFSADLDSTLDRLLEHYKVGERTKDGYLNILLEGLSQQEMMDRFGQIQQELLSRNYPERMVDVLRRADFDAWLNPVGHIAITPPDSK